MKEIERVSWEGTTATKYSDIILTSSKSFGKESYQFYGENDLVGRY
jgi:hypothetical protein